MQAMYSTNPFGFPCDEFPIAKWNANASLKCIFHLANLINCKHVKSQCSNNLAFVHYHSEDSSFGFINWDFHFAENWTSFTLANKSDNIVFYTILKHRINISVSASFATYHLTCCELGFTNKCCNCSFQHSYMYITMYIREMLAKINS